MSKPSRRPAIRRPLLDQAASTRYVRGMQIDLTPEQQEFVRQAIESGRFERPEDVVQAAMTLWVDRERRRAEILTAVAIARASTRSGDSIEINQDSRRALDEDVTISA